ncbi:hypothetical protein FPQ18DRAFT_420402 [Pyronema domesticum]|uniref:Similar to Rhamnolipids biosynthesis 3-oxoacyl-[acyl-carrier-protein] reductase acc. no. Q9RPT1 n=1 Tax=Pyronema omphalodes (strain CBS 100304) TaxID=1076935 RepID=U4LE62_PYROM|nr:hypothetical protein FPQ18DRAFT_420402 [Pyronema domesticum]CCX13055.1 Similar to Rhamnolipids biosynthesis 3-oxoacyl-[acyl-carrier-protein] reductase; acc. no. Q9RPT1 [Pyronema omphalodes CBS 100304]
MSDVDSSNPLLAQHLFTTPSFKAVVTGGGTGIGLMITQALAANGATVYITGRRSSVLETTASTYEGKIIPMTADHRSQDSIQALVKEISQKEPNGIHLLVNNAGVAEEQSTTAFSTDKDLDFTNAEAVSEHLKKSRPEDWQKTMETNVAAVYFTAVNFIPLLAKGTANTRGYSSSIVNICSISGVMKTSSSGQFAYAASKAAALQLTRNLATTLKECKIRVNAIAPGVFPSEMTAGGSDERNKSELKGMGDSLPAGRTGRDEDMAAAILYLVGRGGLLLNGQVLYPDGGNLLTQPSVA